MDDPVMHRVGDLLRDVAVDGRTVLFEHEAYRVLEWTDAAAPPSHVFLPRERQVTAGDIETFPGERVVLKIISPDITHKTDVGGIEFVAKNLDAVNQGMAVMLERADRISTDVRGALLCRCVERERLALGDELFVGIRGTREFGPVISAGLGGVDTELFAKRMKKGFAVATASVLMTQPEDFLILFKSTLAYEILSGAARGHRRRVSDEELIKCFAAFMTLAKAFCSHGDSGPRIAEFEVNPFAFVEGRMIPLDGLCRLGSVTAPLPSRPIEKIAQLLRPRSIAVVGVSARETNIGRIILNNIIDSGMPPQSVYVVKEGMESLDGLRCYPSVTELPRKVDVMVLAVSAGQIPALVERIVAYDAAESVVMIPGGMGETDASKQTERQIADLIRRSHRSVSRGPVFVGGNCMGIQSRPGKYDTFFIPPHKLLKRWDRPGHRLAFVSQSGAFLITRMSNLGTLDPQFAISIGNQVDLTVSDFVRFLDADHEVDVFAVYVEGFSDMDGLELAGAIRNATAKGKDVVFYKAGRTAEGRSATAGHTASIAGDYDVCESVISNAGAIVAETFHQFEATVQLAVELRDKRISGLRVGAISNAGYETVAVADAVSSPWHRVSLADFSVATRERLGRIMHENGLEKLVNVRNPLDINPTATDAVHAACIRTVLEDENLDAVLACFVPLTPNMMTAPEEYAHPSSMVHELAEIRRKYDKPLVVVVDSGALYDPIALAIRDVGLPVLRSSDQAMRILGRYLCHKIAWQHRGRPLETASNRLQELLLREGMEARAPTIAASAAVECG